MIKIATVKKNKSVIKDFFMQYEYEIILLIFLILRFVFKNIPDIKEYFTEQPLFGLTNTVCIITGAAVVLVVCVFLAITFGRIIRKSGTEFEKPVLYLTAFFFACPASLPFLFNKASLSGTQMLYPFALFLLSVYIISKPFIKWLIPLILAMYFLPAQYTSEIFFISLRKSAIFYVPLILLILYLDLARNQIEPGSKKNISKERKHSSASLFYTCLIVSIFSNVFSLICEKSIYVNFYSVEQRINGYFAICLLITAPALAAAGAVLFNAIKNNFSVRVLRVFIYTPVMLFFLSSKNYYGIWVPFLVISLFLLILYAIRQKNPAMLSAIRTTGNYLSEHNFLFYFVLMVMASYSNVTSSFLSAVFQKIFWVIPY